MTKTGQYQRCISAIHCLETSGALALGAIFVLAVLGPPPAQAQTYIVAHRFKGSPTDGAEPAGQGHLIGDSAGNLYGTTDVGGIGCRSGCGTVFKLDKAGETVLYSFTDGADGALPNGGLVRDSAGNLYGTTSLGSGAVYGNGAVFKLDTTGTLTVLHTFQGSPTDGAYVNGGLVLDSAGNLYGTTSSSGGYGVGVVFKVDTTGKETVLYSFTGGADGGYPEAGPTRDSAGNLYGTTDFGGTIGGPCLPYGGCGVVFKLDTTGKETVLYSFTGGADGWGPAAGVIRDSAGNLYGTTGFGGITTGVCSTGCGVVFKLTP